MVPLTAGDTVELQGYFRAQDGYFAADHTSLWGCKIGYALGGLTHDTTPIGGLVATLAGSAWARAALRHGATAFAILLFLLALRRSGERMGCLAERLDAREKANEVQRRMLETAARRPRSRDDLAERLAQLRSRGIRHLGKGGLCQQPPPA
jgi:hypothetical protein